MGAGASDYLTSYADVSHGFLDAELAMDDLHALAARGRFHQVRIRLKQGLDPNGTRRDADSDSDSDGGDEYARGDTPLICAARGHRWDKGRERHVRTMAVLVQFGAAVNQHNRLEQTALFVACDRNLPLVAEWLVGRGADVNKACKSGETPLMCAYRHQNEALVDLLLHHGAVVTRPPRQWSCLKRPAWLDLDLDQFPSLVDHMADREAAAPASPRLLESKSPSNNEEKGVLPPPVRASTAAGPARPRWLPRVAGSIACRPSTTPTDGATRKARTRPSEPGPSVASALATAVERERDARERLAKQLEDAQSVEDQRVYHARLASESRKRRDRRRAQREGASRLRQEAAAERKVESVKAAMGLTMTPEADAKRGDARVRTQHRELLAWERVEDAGASGERPRDVRARPKWVARAVWSAAQQENGGHGVQLELLRDCQSLLDSNQRARDRRERLLALTEATPVARPETAPV